MTQALARETASIVSLRSVSRHRDGDTIFVADVDAIYKYVASALNADDGATWVKPNNISGGAGRDPIKDIGRWKLSISGTGSGGGGLSDWTEDVDGNLLPNGDGTQSLGSKDFRVADVITKKVDIFAGDSLAFPVTTIDENGITFGSGAGAGDVRLYRSPGDAPGELYAQTNSGIYQLTPPAGLADSPFNQVAEVISPVDLAAKFIIGGNAPMGSLEAGFYNIARFTQDNPAGTPILIVDNPSEANGGYAAIAALNSIGSGAALFSASIATSDAGAGINPGDMGLFAYTVKDIDPPVGAAFVIHSGILATRWNTYGGLQIEKMRLTPSGELLLGRTTALDAPHSIFDIQRDQNTQTQISLRNRNAHANARVSLVFETSGPQYAEVGKVSAVYTLEPIFDPGCTFIRNEDTTPGGGIVICTQADTPVRVKTNGNNTRWKVDGDGKMGWNGVPTVAQPTITDNGPTIGDALVALGLVADGR